MKKKLLALGAVIVASIATFITINSQAFQSGGSLVSFNMTNCLQPSTAITSWPTNGFTTNAMGTVGSLTGSGVYIGYVDHVGIQVSGQNVSTNVSATNVIGIGFVTSMTTGTPQVVSGTNIWTQNVTNLTRLDWSLQTNWVVLTLPGLSTTNQWFTLDTNFVVSTVAGDADWIGIVAVTNNGFNGGFVTNFDVSCITKFTVKPFSP